MRSMITHRLLGKSVDTILLEIRNASGVNVTRCQLRTQALNGHLKFYRQEGPIDFVWSTLEHALSARSNHNPMPATSNVRVRKDEGTNLQAIQLPRYDNNSVVTKNRSSPRPLKNRQLERAGITTGTLVRDHNRLEKRPVKSSTLLDEIHAFLQPPIETSEASEPPPPTKPHDSIDMRAPPEVSSFPMAEAPKQPQGPDDVTWNHQQPDRASIHGSSCDCGCNIQHGLKGLIDPTRISRLNEIRDLPELQAKAIIAPVAGVPFSDSCTSSMSSGFRSIKAISVRVRGGAAPSRTAMSSLSSGNMSWTFGTGPSLHSDSFAHRRNHIATIDTDEDEAGTAIVQDDVDLNPDYHHQEPAGGVWPPVNPIMEDDTVMDNMEDDPFGRFEPEE